MIKNPSCMVKIKSCYAVAHEYYNNTTVVCETWIVFFEFAESSSKLAKVQNKNQISM